MRAYRVISLLSVYLFPLPFHGLSAEEGPHLKIYKGLRRLEVYQGGELIKTYSIALGFDPNGTKLKQGDGKTPEGEYLVVVKNPTSQFHLSLGLNYPNKMDAERGLKGGLIDKALKKRIEQAVSEKTLPPQDTTLGGEIFIHGGGIGWDWTRGCIALKNEDIEELYAKLPVGTPVTILP